MTIVIAIIAIAFIIASVMNIIAIHHGNYSRRQLNNGLRGIVAQFVPHEVVEATSAAVQLLPIAIITKISLDHQQYGWTLFFTIGAVITVVACFKESRYN